MNKIEPKPFVKPVYQDSMYKAQAIWNVLRDNPLNSDIACRKICDVTHSGASDVYEAGAEIIKELQGELDDAKLRLRVLNRRIKQQYSKCPSCHAPNSAAHKRNCWVSQVMKTKTWNSSSNKIIKKVAEEL